ncbi:unnamed protein product [Schistocephalus solidus]|uniref:Uncharacterized protein n=1 Tax=Schistocephalus solidus TaxID=70667 RepID=A0A183TM10_SCHSO|nr:unnamed protein product [Schistocephalus solidus]
MADFGGPNGRFPVRFSILLTMNVRMMEQTNAGLKIPAASTLLAGLLCLLMPRAVLPPRMFLTTEYLI